MNLMTQPEIIYKKFPRQKKPKSSGKTQEPKTKVKICIDPEKGVYKRVSR